MQHQSDRPATQLLAMIVVTQVHEMGQTASCHAEATPQVLDCTTARQGAELPLSPWVESMLVTSSSE